LKRNGFRRLLKNYRFCPVRVELAFRPASTTFISRLDPASAGGISVLYDFFRSLFSRAVHIAKLLQLQPLREVDNVSRGSLIQEKQFSALDVSSSFSAQHWTPFRTSNSSDHHKV
jgi:hypothetical protein